MTMKGGTSPACSACKYQRRRCSPDCILAPYFPASQSKAFQNAHRLFGVSNIMKILKQLNTVEQKEEAMLSIKYESDARERDPVHGCTGIIIDLRKQIRQASHELYSVYSHIAFYREQFLNNNQQMQMQLGIHNSSNPTTTTFAMDCPMGYEGNDVVVHNHNHVEYTDALAFANHLPGLDPESADAQHLDPCYEPAEAYYDLMRGDNPVLNHVPVATDALQHEAFDNPEMIPLQEFENMELNAMVDDRQSFVETKEASESSSRSTLRDFPELVERVSENELKNAAACLSLTSVNKGGVEIF